MLEIAIIGGGLCGLALANSLKAEGMSYAVFESRSRLGGRIHSIQARNNGLALDMGAAWFWPQAQPRIAQLIDDLGLDSFAQHDTGTLLSQNKADAIPSSLELEDLHSGARRISGGTATLIQALGARLPAETLHMDHILNRLADRGDHVELQLKNGSTTLAIQARQVVLALPPRLVVEHLVFDPPLNGQLRASLRETPTWMAGNAKALAVYGDANGMDAAGINRAAFWREDGLSGNAVAGYPRAVLSEVHDACDALGARAALSAFFALPASVRGAFRLGLPLFVRSQLGQLFGARAQAAEIHIQDWADETWTCAKLDQMPCETHPTYGNPLLQTPAWNGQLHFGGSETAAFGGGYMEGALEAAGRLRREILVTHAARLNDTPEPTSCAF